MPQLDRRTVKKIASQSLTSTLEPRTSLSELYHENTKLTPLNSRSYSQAMAEISRSPQLVNMMSQAYKVYTLRDEVELPEEEPGNQLEEVVAKRRSARSFTGEAVALEDLSALLFYTYGKSDPAGRFRAVASAGALYPLEIYLVVRNVTGLDRGVYHYNVDHHSLDVLSRDDRWDDLKNCVWMQDTDDPDSPALAVVFTAIFRRSTLKYQDRGYRMILIEAGLAAQNLALMATSRGLGSYFVGGFLDNPLGELLGIDGVDEAPLLPVILGQPKVSNP